MKTLGSFNAVFPCTVFKDGKAVAFCADTPNSIAYAMAHTGGDVAKGTFGKYHRDDENLRDRVTHAGWFTNAKDALVVIL